MRRRLLVAVALLLAAAAPATAQQVEPTVHTLDNGMKLLLVPRPGDPNIAAGWIAKVGSVNEKPGITGVAHLFEHMMFKGTRVIGTADIEEDLRIIAHLDELENRIREHEKELQRQERLGIIDDWQDPEHRSEEHRRLIDEFETALAEQQQLIVKDEFDRIYTGAGASGMNAGTTNDFTVYFINVPANKLELWFWMESDRLANPVFREFYSERDVVHEERRLRTDSTPTGKFEEQLDAMFWKSSPYGWPVVGWPSDLEGITREEALEFFDLYYAPNNLTAALVGDFETEEAIDLAERYFGRLERGPEEPQPVRTTEIEQQAEQRMVAFAETTPQVKIRWHTVADGHVDEPALLVLGQILSGRTGRLYRALVEDQEIATDAGAGQSGYKYEGRFEVRATAKQGHDPVRLEEAIYAELDRLAEEPVGERELQKVKNQNAAAEYRRLQSSFGLMLQLLVADAYRGWETINEFGERLQAVRAEDVQRVAQEYFTDENRTVALYYREAGAEPEDPRLAGLDDTEKQQVRQMMAQLEQATEDDLDALRQQLAQFESMAAQVPEEGQDMFELILELVRERIRELEGGEQ
ncbi:MAG: M16 family metallopeptidase [Acidobacteriota bacterium]